MSIIIFGVISLFLFLIGFLGLAVPFMPGLPLAWFGYFLYAWAGDFEKISALNAIIFLALTIFSSIFDFVAPIIGAKKYKASKFGILGAGIGVLIGVFLIGPIGIILGPFLGAFLGELMADKKIVKAIKPAFGTFMGFIFGLFLKIIIIFVMFGFFIASLLK